MINKSIEFFIACELCTSECSVQSFLLVLLSNLKILGTCTLYKFGLMGFMFLVLYMSATTDS